MRILVINPNTTASMTAKIGASAQSFASPGTEILARNPAAGPASIEGHFDEAMAAPGLLEEVRRRRLSWRDNDCSPRLGKLPEM